VEPEQGGSHRGWERSTVSVADVLLLALAFRVSITEFFEGDGDVLLAEHLAPLPREWVIAIMQGNYPQPEITQREAVEQEGRDVEQMFATIDAFKRGPNAIEADQALARRLKVAVEDVVQVARALWGHTLTDERDARVVELGAVETAERQARRGHITRSCRSRSRRSFAPRTHRCQTERGGQIE